MPRVSITSVCPKQTSASGTTSEKFAPIAPGPSSSAGETISTTTVIAAT